jgi:hypothetical protein
LFFVFAFCCFDLWLFFILAHKVQKIAKVVLTDKDIRIAPRYAWDILLLFLSKQNKTTKCKNKKQVFVFFFVSPWGNDLSLSAFCCSLEQRTKNKE